MLRVEVYRSGAKKLWFWRAKAANGKILADGSEGYYNRSDLLDTLVKVLGIIELDAFGSEFAHEPYAYNGYREDEVVRIEVLAT